WDTRFPSQDIHDLHDILGHRDRILDAEFTPSGLEVVTASADDTARVWLTRTGELLGVLSNHLNYVTKATFSPDGETLATASRDRIARIFDPDGRLRATLVGHHERVVDVAFAKDGQSV